MQISQEKQELFEWKIKTAFGRYYSKRRNGYGRRNRITSRVGIKKIKNKKANKKHNVHMLNSNNIGRYVITNEH